MPRRRHTELCALPTIALCVSLAGCASTEPTSAGEDPGMRLTPLVVQAEDAVETGDTEEAIRLLVAAIEENPSETTAYARLGELQLETGAYEGAERTYRSLVRLEPRVFDNQYFHGLSLHHLGRLTEAVRAYLRALVIDPGSFDAHLNLATAYLQLEEPAQALPYARRAVEIDDESGRAWANLGAALSSFSDRDKDLEAITAYEQASELMEITPELLGNWASTLGRLDRFREMLNILDRSLELDETAFAHERKGFAHFKLREYDAAEAAFRKAIEVDARYYPAMNGLGVCLLNDWITTGRENAELKREAIGVLRNSLRVNNRQPRIVDLVSRYG